MCKGRMRSGDARAIVLSLKCFSEKGKRTYLDAPCATDRIVPVDLEPCINYNSAYFLYFLQSEILYNSQFFLFWIVSLGG